MTDTARDRAAAFVLDKLSEREVEVFMRILKGETLAEIGEALGLSHSSVSTYRARVLRKLGQDNDAGLVLLGAHLGFIQYGATPCGDP